MLGEYHRAIGALVHAYEGTLERFTGDGIMVFFNDPVPCDDAAERAVRMALEIRDAVSELAARWRRNGHDLALGIGIAQGFRDPRPDRLRGPLRLRRHRQRHESRRPAVFRRRSLAGTGHRPRARGHRARGRIRNGRRRAAQGIQPLGAGPQHQRARRQAGEHMTQLQAPDQRSAGRPLSHLDEDERYRAFDDLQLAMPAVWESMRLGFDDESVVVVPSISIERTTAGSGTIMQAMEERALFLLLLLRQPRLRMIYVTSQPVSEAIVEYYLGLLPGVIPSHARARLTLVPVGDASPVPLSAKLLARPRLLREIRSLIPNPARSHLIPYNTTPLERDVALSASVSRCTARIPGSRTSAARPAAAGCSRNSGCGVRWGPRTSTRSTTSWPACRACARRRPSLQPGDREAQRGRLGRRQRHGGPARAAGPWLVGRGGRDR